MTTILTKKKDTTGAPSAGDLTNSSGGAELAVNTFDKRLYTKDSGGNVVEVGTNPSELQIDNININGNTISSTDSNGNIVLAPNGTGDVQVDADTLRIGDSNADATLTTNGTGDLILNTNAGTNSGAITIADGVNGNISLTPNGTGEVAITKVNIDGGAIDGTTIGGATPAAGSFTTLGATGDATFSGTGQTKLQAGSTAQRSGSPTGGMLRFNTDSNEFEGYNGSSWASVGGAAISNDTSTSSNVYPLFADATSGTATTVYTSNAKLLYKPSTGELQASEMVASNGIVVNSQTVSADYTIPSGSNAMSAGPVTVDSGVTVTVSSGSVWTVI